MKQEVYIQFFGEEIHLKSVEEKIKEKWKLSGKKIKDLKHVYCYVNVEERKVYIKINDEDSMVISKDELN